MTEIPEGCLPPTPTTTAELIERAARDHGDRAFIVDGPRCWSFNATLNDVRALAAVLLQRGLGHGDVAAIWSPNCGEWIIAALAIQYIGGTVVTLNTRYKGAEAAAILADSGASLLFVVDRFLNVDYALSLEGHDCGKLKHQITIELEGGTGTSNGFAECIALGRHALADEATAAVLAERRARVTGHTVSDILFTSGTTGRAKGVVTLHEQNLRAFSIFGHLLGLDADDRYLIINPFFHSFGYKAGWLAALLVGASVYPLAVFDVPTVLEQIETHNISVMPGPPTLFQSILSHPALADSDISSLRKATTGAATIPTQLIIAMREQLGIDTVLTAYGLSESSGLATICRSGDSPEVIAHTSGRAIPGVEVAIMSDNHTLLPPGETGEIVIRGFNVMHGYLDNPAATAEAIDAEGWLHTGDVGRLDEAGNLRITDRLKDMFICGGFNCYPAEIENQMLNHGDVAQVAVVGMPDPRMGEVTAAFVVPKPGGNIDIDELTAWCREHMANYKVPRRIEVLDALPLNASGKVLKTQLRAHLTAA